MAAVSVRENDPKLYDLGSNLGTYFTTALMRHPNRPKAQARAHPDISYIHSTQNISVCSKVTMLGNGTEEVGLQICNCDFPFISSGAQAGKNMMKACANSHEDFVPAS